MYHNRRKWCRRYQGHPIESRGLLCVYGMVSGHRNSSDPRVGMKNEVEKPHHNDVPDILLIKLGVWCHYQDRKNCEAGRRINPFWRATERYMETYLGWFPPGSRRTRREFMPYAGLMVSSEFEVTTNLTAGVDASLSWKCLESIPFPAWSPYERCFRTHSKKFPCFRNSTGLHIQSPKLRNTLPRNTAHEVECCYS